MAAGLSYERQVAALAELEGGAEKIEAQFDVARVLADQVRRAKTVRDEAIVSVLDAVAAAKQGELELSEFAPAIEAARARLAESEEHLSKARKNRGAAKARAVQHHEDLSRFRQIQEVAQLQRRLDRVTSATTLIQDSLAAAAVPVDQDALDSLRAQHRTVEIARARLEAGQPKVAVQAAADLRLKVGGETVEVSRGEVWERRVAGLLEVTVDGVVTVTVSTGAGDEEAQALTEAARGLTDLLNRNGAADLTEAERLHRLKTEAQQVIGEQRRIRAESLDDLTAESMEARLLALRTGATERGAVATQDPGTDEEAVHAAAEEGDRALDRSERSLREAEQEAESARGRSNEFRDAQLGRETELRIAVAELERREHVLADDRERTSDAEIQIQLLAAEEVEQGHRDRLLEAKAEIAREGVAQARDALENAKQAVARVDSEVRKVEDELIEVRTRLRDHGEDGLAEDRDAAVATRDHLLLLRERYKSRAAARKVLFDILRGERDAARKAYVTPLRRQIENLGSYVFGTDFSVELDDQDLRVLSRTVLGRTVPFESLSVGAQEQIALISRLSCATIVAPDGGVPVILDDALGNSDPQRLEAMGAVLAVAGRQCQIIVLTCQPDRYRHVGSATVVRLS